ncbi:MAG TPA: DUF3857 domain-containing protein, partial [Chitinophagaceae bacterium]|nr:DUF3857 domain-containing protein [Chitinophagaceae bacterium]
MKRPSLPCRLAALSLLFILVSTAVRSQEAFPEYGMLTQADKSMKQCAFDPDADAVVLFHSAKANYNEEWNLVTDHHIRIKVLKASGAKQGDVSIYFYSQNNFETIGNLQGQVFNPDASGTWTSSELNRKNVYTKKINGYFSELTFALPQVKEGSILEYRYTSIQKHYGGLDNWEFQKELPVVRSGFMLYIIPNAEFAYSVYKAPNLNIEILPFNQEGKVYYEMRNVPGLRDEPFMANRKDNLQQVKFQFAGMNMVYGDAYHVSKSKKNHATTWPELNKMLLLEDDFGSQLKKELAGAKELKAAWALLPGEVERMKAVFFEVRNRMEWNGVNSIFASTGVKKAWEKRAGTSGDINICLVNLLLEAGLESTPVLASERRHGRVDTTYPYMQQFNKVIARVVAGGHTYHLDATDDQTPPHLIPFELLNT